MNEKGSHAIKASSDIKPNYICNSTSYNTNIDLSPNLGKVQIQSKNKQTKIIIKKNKEKPQPT